MKENFNEMNRGTEKSGSMCSTSENMGLPAQNVSPACASKQMVCDHASLLISVLTARDPRLSENGLPKCLIRFVDMRVPYGMCS